MPDIAMATTAMENIHLTARSTDSLLSPSAVSSSNLEFEKPRFV